MSNELRLKDNYTLSNCCQPEPTNIIIGYYSHDNIIKIHKKSCSNVKNVEDSRLLNLTWDEIIETEAIFEPGQDFEQLDQIDFAILQHHLDFGIDYSLFIARKLNITKQEAFDHHKKLKDSALVERVDATMVQYRKGIVDNKWIKHRNHTYYQITPRGENYLNYYKSQAKR